MATQGPGDMPMGTVPMSDNEPYCPSTLTPWLGGADFNSGQLSTTPNYLSFTPMQPLEFMPQQMLTDALPMVYDIADPTGDLDASIGVSSSIVVPFANGSQHLSVSHSPVTESVFFPRTEYAARRLASQVYALAETGQTSFIHHTQIAASTELQEALAASALHSVRNDKNNTIIRLEISRRVQLLISAVELVMNSPLGLVDLLHPVQALLIYQCMRLFAVNDLAQQAQAERDGSKLLSWAELLRTQLQPFANSTGWQNWIRDESVRRTVVFAELLMGVYKFLKSGVDEAAVRMAPLGFTAQAALWDAKTAAEWQHAWLKLPRLHLTIGSLDRDMERANPGDFEELGIVVRATHAGLEVLEEWLGDDSSALRRWGLKD